jgi:hypothetical protein
MANEESIIGLLLRAYGQCSEQKHGEEYLHHNDNAAASYRHAVRSIGDAIQSVIIAEMYVRKQEERKAVEKEFTKKHPEVKDGPTD